MSVSVCVCVCEYNYLCVFFHSYKTFNNVKLMK